MDWILSFGKLESHVLFCLSNKHKCLFSSNNETLLFLPDDSHPLWYVDNKNGRDSLENLKADILGHVTVLRNVLAFQMAASFPTREWLSLIVHIPTLSTPSYFSSSGRFLIQLLSCKKFLLLFTSWKPCCLSVVPCVVLFISVNRKK